MRVGTIGGDVAEARGTSATLGRSVSVLALTAVLALAACGHDWSPAGDAGDTRADLPDAPADQDGTTEDGTSPDEGTSPDDATLLDADDAGTEDAPPVDCVENDDCDDDNPCTLDLCDPTTHTCAGEKLDDNTPCGTDGICCDGNCVSARDTAHCGSCANVCPGGPHAAPVCAEGGCSLSCEPGWLDCLPSEPGCETDPSGDERFCGACDRSCNDGQTCLDGSCVPSWTPTSTDNPPSPRRQVVGFWTGSRMIVWGGHAGGACFRDGGRYDPAADAWQTLTLPPPPVTGCYRTAAVWADTEMIVWSGLTAVGDTTPEEGGGRYDPTTNSWSLLSETGPDPTPRISPAAVWTGSQMIVWSGVERRWDTALSSGARYDPSTDAWISMSSTGAPPGSWGASAVWTGSRMVVWGGWGTGTGSALRSGGSYDPATDLWYSMSTTDAPSARGEARAVWTGREMLVWGGAAVGTLGSNPSSPLGDGAAYDPAADSWRPLGSGGAPAARFQNAAVWTGSQMIVWGGTSAGSTPAFADGALYDPDLDAWTPVTNNGAPSPRRAAAYVWTGERFVVWGGGSYDPPLGATENTDTGGRYRPR
ncbi:MAG: hypothetical protein JXB32_04290 [Deltaproteobacteria bacterium]|nr:hypothetical protein [Deltaproteobacteria bacterium]